MNREERRKIAAKNGGWGPWEQGVIPDITEDRVQAMHRATGQLLEHVRQILDELRTLETIWMNAVYQVNIRRYPADDRRPAVLHLSIKRRDKRPVGVEHFRDFQRIKNDLVGADHEAAEIYPAEDRLVDASNQYHLWCLEQAGVRFPFGFTDRMVLDHEQAAIGGAVQRPFDQE